MFKLSENWLTDGVMDVEYKQYLVLAYLRDVHHVFKTRILYPPFAELIEHHRRLKKIKYNLSEIKRANSEIKGIDLQNMRLIYGTNNNDDETINTIIDDILDFTIPRMEKEIVYGKKIFDEIESKLKYNTVGIQPLRKDRGYFFIQDYPSSDFYAYRYEVSALYMQTEEGDVPVKSLKTEYISTYTLSLSKSLTSIKQEVISKYPDIPNPAVYSFFPGDVASIEYTVLPIVKRMIIKFVA